MERVKFSLALKGMLKSIRPENGVSEVVGTILIIAITVILFSSIFVYVEQIPRPTLPVQVYFSSEVSYSASDIMYENITDEGGSIVQLSSLTLVLLIGKDVLRFPLDELSVTPHQSSYLEPGDTIHFSYSLAGEQISSVESIIEYAPTGQVLWESSYSVP
ncbi:MAG: type IV pilin N-terminal domain-containing protein [Thermoplasmatales archaeon]